MDQSQLPPLTIDRSVTTAAFVFPLSLTSFLVDYFMVYSMVYFMARYGYLQLRWEEVHELAQLSNMTHKDPQLVAKWFDCHQYTGRLVVRDLPQVNFIFC